jgi:superfamily I DNA/RNA helicase
MKPVTSDEIKKAEKILLPEGETFGGEGSERVKVIKELDKSCDVVACPGSGKTTVLLAKLLILANRMPFEDDRGICVLTHTNVAIDEIKRKAGIAGDKLFNYPNFFGTFQKFVDKFLAIPYNSSEYGNRLNKIGREHYFGYSGDVDPSFR